MMAHKHLHELLNEDQEPFNLKSYIAERRCELKRHNPGTTLQVKRKPITETSASPLVPKRSSFCKHACFLSFHDPPDIRKSPFPDFLSPAKSPCKVVLNVQAKTAALLLEAAVRVQKKQTVAKRSKTQIKHVGFGLFGSILKKLKDRNKNKTREIGNIIKDEVREKEKVSEGVRIISAYEMGLLGSCSCSESNEEKSFDLESSSSCRSEDSLEDAFASYEKLFCSSPFKFSLQRTSSAGHRMPDFRSPTPSPSRHKKEEKEKYEATEGLNESEVKEHAHAHEGGDEYQDYDKEDNDYDLECSYAIVQRAKHKLLDKLRRFERLAELDPIELEKIMTEQMDEEEDYEDSEYDESLSEHDNDCLVTKVLSQSSFHYAQKVSPDMNKLVYDIISFEQKNDKSEVVIRSVCEKLNSWKEVESNTIDMMVQLDFGREFHVWKNYQEHVSEIAMEMEVHIWRILVKELTEELVYSSTE